MIDCSTIDAARARAIAARLAAKGIAFLDAPVSGGQKGAVEGTLTFFVGGDAAALEKARPVFEAMGKRLTHLGPSGAGQLGKAANQILVANNLMAVSEALAFAAKAGLPLGPLHEALVGGAARSWALEVLGQKMIDRDFKPAFAVKHQQKDLAIVLAERARRGRPAAGRRARPPAPRRRSRPRAAARTARRRSSRSTRSSPADVRFGSELGGSR